MSYGPPKPPTTAYGDQDFIKEDWASDQPQQRQPTYERPARLQANSPFVAPLQPIHELPQQPTPFDPANNGNVTPKNFTEALGSLTPEDLIFMNSWRRDSFMYRVLPLSVAGMGGLYYYNKTKNLPHRIPYYAALMTACFVAGKFSYRSELKRRIENSTSTTPYMQGCRKLMGIPPLVGEFDPTGGPSFDSRSADWNATQASGYYPPQPPVTGNFSPRDNIGARGLNYQPSERPLPEYSSQPLDSDEHQRRNLTYEELRARNRGNMSR